MNTALLDITALSVSFTQYAGAFRTRTVHVVEDLNLDIGPGEIVAVIGASGSGKTLLAHAVLGILPANATVTGTIRYRGKELTRSDLRRILGREISFIPQSVTYLDPLMPVGKQVRIGLEPASAGQVQRRLFRRYGLDEQVGKQYPFQLSGGMLRRVLFATSVREGVRLVIADEPTPGLHPEAMEEILLHLREIAEEGAGVMLITHDIISAAKIAHRVAVMRSGRLVTVEEAAAFTDAGDRLKHDYARQLWRALPQNDFWQEGEE
jgi:peptide/nickel transport system ATP-binding protein